MSLEVRGVKRADPASSITESWLETIVLAAKRKKTRKKALLLFDSPLPIIHSYLDQDSSSGQIVQ